VGKRPGLISSSSDSLAKTSEGNDTARNSIGIRVESLSPRRIAEGEMGDVLGVLVLRVEPGSVADDAGLKVNDVIEAINRKSIKSAGDFKEAITSLDSGDPVVLQVHRRKRQYPRIFVSFSKP
jgi:S1-C subfamily serine protease